MQRVNGTELIGVCAATGAHSRHAADKFRFRYSTTDERQILNDSNINTVVIATRHHLHAREVLAALAEGKHVFCEKPLCLSEDELLQIVQAVSGSPQERKPLLMVGFNRRFSPMAGKMKKFFDIREPIVMHYRVNAGALPVDHWINDPEVGGGRIVGEVCHFVDLLSFLAGSLPVEVEARGLSSSRQSNDESVMVSMRFANGSEGSIHYLVNGDRAFSKERIEIFGGGGVAVLDDFRKMEMTRFGRRSTLTSRWRQDKGHHAEWQAFTDSLRSGASAPIPFQSIVATTLATFGIVQSRLTGQPVPVDTEAFMRRTPQQHDF